jgi:hypothetical protein
VNILPSSSAVRATAFEQDKEFKQFPRLDGCAAGTPLVLGIVGLTLGTAQWPIIRRHLSRSWLWIVASAFGMALGLTAGVTLVEQVGRVLIGGQSTFECSELPAEA